MSRPTVGSLFSGVGGFDMGLEQAGFEVLWQVEIDKDAVSVLERHWPNVRRYRDVREVKGYELPAVDVLAGGFPCQDLSVAGRRQGLAGERSGLFFEIARIAAETATPWLLLENVDGLLSSWVTHDPPPSDLGVGQRWESDETSSLGIVLSALAELGYGWSYRVLDAQYFGVAQRRRRVFIVGCLGDSGARAAEVLLEPESVFWDLAACLETGQGAASVPANGAGSRGVNNQAVLSGHVIPVAAPLTAGGHPNSNAPGRHREDDENLVVAAFHGAQITSPANQARVEPGLPVPTLNGDARTAVAFHASQTPVHGPVSPSLGASAQIGDADLGVTHSLTTRSGATEDGTGRGTPRAASPDGSAVRRLMPVEAERLMGWPDRWTERRADGSLIPDGTRYRLIGNGVVANVSAWIGRRLRAALEAGG